MLKNTGIIIEARMNSSRLPGKVLMRYKKMTFLNIMISRLKKSKLSKTIVVATTINKKDDRIVKFLKKKKIKYFRGSENNVIDRVINSAKKFNIHTIIKICGDSPIVDYRIVDQMLKKYKKIKIDYLSNNLTKSYPDGMDVEIFNIKTLEKSYSLSKSNLNKEHVTYFIKKSKLFKKKNFKASKKNFYPELKVTIDTYKDFLFVSKIFDMFKGDIFFSCNNMIQKIKKGGIIN